MKAFSRTVVKNLSDICKRDFNAKVKQAQDQPWMPHYLLISGLKCTDAKKWLLGKLSDLEKLSFPEDWEDPVKHFLEETNLHTYVLPQGHKTYKEIERRIGNQGKI